MESTSKTRALTVAYVCLALLTLLPQVSSALALLTGIAFSLFFGNPVQATTKRWTSRLLQISVVGMGAGMNLLVVMKAGAHGILYTCLGIAATLALGTLLGKWLKNNATVSLLISTGTAICGASAIAAIAPVIRANDEDISLSLVIVFFLNSVALLVFPYFGHQLALTETQFGYWSALAIHDTSSVVGSALQYGPQALELAIVTKLARALWIIPLAFLISYFWKGNGEQNSRIKYPWFILWFLVAAALVTWIPFLQTSGMMIHTLAKRTLVLTLFLIGSALPKSAWTKTGMKTAFLQGVLLWVVVSVVTLQCIRSGWIQ